MASREARVDGDEPRSGEPPGVITLGGSGSLEQLLRRVVARIQSRGLEIFSVIDHSGEAEDAGLAMPETKLVMFGNPRAGTPLMLAHPLIALDLPLKLLLWETTDQGVYLTYNAPSYLAERYLLSEQEASTIRVVEAIAREAVST